MTHVITSLCLRDGGCVTVCPVECIIPGKPEDEYPLFYIDPETCIDCGACIPECPFHAIFPKDDVPASFVSDTPKVISKPNRLTIDEDRIIVKKFENVYIFYLLRQ